MSNHNLMSNHHHPTPRSWLRASVALALVATVFGCASDDTTEQQRRDHLAAHHGDFFDRASHVHLTREPGVQVVHIDPVVTGTDYRQRTVSRSPVHPVSRSPVYPESRSPVYPESDTERRPVAFSRSDETNWIDDSSARGASPYPDSERVTGHGSSGELRLDGRSSPRSSGSESSTRAPTPTVPDYTPLAPRYRSWNQPTLTSENVDLYRTMVQQHLNRTDTCVEAIGELDAWSSNLEEALWISQCSEVRRLRSEVEQRLGEYESADRQDRPEARSELNRALVRLDRAVEPVYVEFWVLSGQPDPNLSRPFAYRAWETRGLVGAPYTDAARHDLAVDRHLRSVDAELDALEVRIAEAEAEAEQRRRWLETRSALRERRNHAERAFGRVQASRKDMWPEACAHLDHSLEDLDAALNAALAGEDLEYDAFGDSKSTATFNGFRAPGLDVDFDDRLTYEEQLGRDLVRLEECIDRMEQRDEFTSARESAFWQADLRTARVRRSELERRLGRLEATEDESTWTSIRNSIDRSLAATAGWTAARWDEFAAWVADAWDATAQQWREVVGDDYDGWDRDGLDELSYDDRDQLADAMDEFLSDVDGRLDELDRELAQSDDGTDADHHLALQQLSTMRNRAARLRGRLEHSLRQDWSAFKEDVADNLEAMDSKLERTWNDVTSS